MEVEDGLTAFHEGYISCISLSQRHGLSDWNRQIRSDSQGLGSGFDHFGYDEIGQIQRGCFMKMAIFAGGVRIDLT